jgi:hypothetical protein
MYECVNGFSMVEVLYTLQQEARLKRKVTSLQKEERAEETTKRQSIAVPKAFQCCSDNP